MLISWFWFTLMKESLINYTLIVFYEFAFIFMCLFPITLNIWLSTNFRRKTCCIKTSKVLIPHKYANFIENDKKYGHKYQLIAYESSNHDNTNTNNNKIDKMDKYWKFKTNKLCIIKCSQNQNVINRKQTACIYFKIFTLITMCIATLPAIGLLVLLFEFGNYDTISSVSVVFSMIAQIILYIIPCIIIALVTGFGFQHDFRVVDVYHCTIMVSYFYIHRSLSILSCVAVSLLWEMFDTTGACIYYENKFWEIDVYYSLSYYFNTSYNPYY